MSEHSTRQYCRLRNPCLKTTRGLLTFKGPSPGEPAPPRMHVPTHLIVHDSAFLDLGRWILAGFPSSPAKYLEHYRSIHPSITCTYRNHASNREWRVYKEAITWKSLRYVGERFWWVGGWGCEDNCSSKKSWCEAAASCWCRPATSLWMKNVETITGFVAWDPYWWINCHPFF